VHAYAFARVVGNVNVTAADVPLVFERVVPPVGVRPYVLEDAAQLRLLLVAEPLLHDDELVPVEMVEERRTRSS
jgi:hypothetical protein